jgi:uncharacterized protein
MRTSLEGASSRGKLPEMTGLARFRSLRDSLEASVLPLATSLDGRRFSFQASLHGLALRLGGYVALEGAGGSRLGQVTELEMSRHDGAEIDLPGEDGAPAMRAGVPVRLAVGAGVVIEGDGAPFHDAAVRPATADEVAAWTDRTARRAAAVDIGELALAPGVPCRIDARGFDRHTFLCGQSGSGKTYSLGVVLERLLVATGLRIVILDPNSDFVRLATVRAGADAAVATRYAAVAEGVRVHSAAAGAAERLRLRIAELAAPAQAALLHLDPIADREEHAELAELLESGRPPTSDALDAADRPAARALAQRARSLGIERLGVWARGDPGSVLDALGEDAPRCLVADLGSLRTQTEQALVAQAVLGELWRRREERRPVLIVIDEAHNVCPAKPEDALTALATAHAVRIAAEGRKFGLHLLVSTQRPQRVHENVVSQCDNLLLMRLNSAADAAYAQAVFSFVPPGLIGQAAGFGLGEALIAGKVSPHPALLRFGARVAEEGGGDVGADWAAAP